MKNLFNLCVEVIDGNPIVFMVLSVTVALVLLYVEIKKNYGKRILDK
jgi:hypothetical protein